MPKQREKIREEFWAKFVEPVDIRLRAITGNNEALLIRGTAKELWEFIDEKLDDQLQGIIKELERDIEEMDRIQFDKVRAFLEVIKIVEKYK